MRRPPLTAVSCLLLTLIFASRADGQFRQYTPPGGLGGGEDRGKEALEQEMAEARWRLGAVRLDPWFGIRDTTLDDDVFVGSGGESVRDLSVTVGAGLRAYLPTGPDVIWTAEASPQYSLWRDQDERNNLGGSYSVGVAGFFNRLRLEVDGSRRETQQVVTTELPQRIVQRQDRADAGLELRVSGPIWLFASGTLSEVEHLEDSSDDPRLGAFDRLDRREEITRAGISYSLASGLRVALGAERTETTFATTARNLSNTGTAPVLEVVLPGNRAGLELGLAWRSLDPEPGSAFTGYEELGGNVAVTLEPGWRLRFRLYGYRNPVFSLLEDYSHFSSERIGLSVTSALPGDSSLRLYTETGEEDFSPVGPGVADRLDDAEAWGADLTVPLPFSFSLEVGYQHLELDSNLDGFDRQVDRVRAGFRFNPLRLVRDG